MRVSSYRGLATVAFADLDKLCGHAADRQVDAPLDGDIFVNAAADGEIDEGLLAAIDGG